MIAGVTAGNPAYTECDSSNRSCPDRIRRDPPLTTLAWPVFLIGYLLGSIPSAYLASRLLVGKDIRQLGDGNMGAKNTFHSVGWLAGGVVALADFAKGALAVLVARGLHLPELVILIVGGCVVLGHDFPIFVGLRGGQGMATMLGVFAVLFPIPTVAALVVLPLALILTHNWDLSCAVAFITLLGMMLLAGNPPRRLAYPFIMLPSIALRKLMQTGDVRHATS